MKARNIAVRNRRKRALSQARLDGALNCIDGAAEFGQHTIPSGIGDPTAIKRQSGRRWVKSLRVPAASAPIKRL